VRWTLAVALVAAPEHSRSNAFYPYLIIRRPAHTLSSGERKNKFTFRR
jgi:hypothetical protein